MSYRVLIHDDARSRIDRLPPVIARLFWRTLDRQLSNGKPNGGAFPGAEGQLIHRIDIADPDPESDSIYKFAVGVLDQGEVRKITTADYVRTGSEGPQY